MLKAHLCLSPALREVCVRQPVPSQTLESGDSWCHHQMAEEQERPSRKRRKVRRKKKEKYFFFRERRPLANCSWDLFSNCYLCYSHIREFIHYPARSSFLNIQARLPRPTPPQFLVWLPGRIFKTLYQVTNSMFEHVWLMSVCAHLPR